MSKRNLRGLTPNELRYTYAKNHNHRFTSLPTELKLQVLDHLSLANTGRVLSSSHATRGLMSKEKLLKKKQNENEKRNSRARRNTLPKAIKYARIPEPRSISRRDHHNKFAWNYYTNNLESNYFNTNNINNKDPMRNEMMKRTKTFKPLANLFPLKNNEPNRIVNTKRNATRATLRFLDKLFKENDDGYSDHRGNLIRSLKKSPNYRNLLELATTNNNFDEIANTRKVYKIFKKMNASKRTQFNP